jgi:hypothetical protein
MTRLRLRRLASAVAALARRLAELERRVDDLEEQRPRIVRVGGGR